MLLRTELFAHSGIDFPIGGGRGNSQRDAIVLHFAAPKRYVAMEYDLLDAIGVMEGFTWEPMEQRFFRRGGKAYDVVTVVVHSVNASETAPSTRSYYFDITECYGR